VCICGDAKNEKKIEVGDRTLSVTSFFFCGYFYLVIFFFHSLFLLVFILFLFMFISFIKQQCSVRLPFFLGFNTLP
jgi:hypothetical protein